MWWAWLGGSLVTTPEMSLMTKLSLVTGGGSGIGRAVCRLFAEEGASVAVAGNDIAAVKETVETLQETARSAGHTDTSFHAFEVDVSSSKQVNSLFTSLVEKFGIGGRGPPLSIIVNGAGIAKRRPFLELPESEFDDIIDVNLKGTFLVSQAAAKYMVQNKVGNGSIINISSMAGKSGGIGYSGYSASKGGVMAMTLTCAKELGSFGIRCNAVLPGLIDTPMTSDVHVNPALKKFIITATSLGRMGKPEEVAELCTFLASDKSSYITGSCLEIHGGL